jgi:hypothetical protein
VQDQQHRFHAMLSATESAGFQSFDEMAIVYYTAELENEMSSRAIQKLSRERQLKDLVKVLNESTVTWSARELWAFQGAIIESAQELLTRELSDFHQRSRCAQTKASMGNTSSSGNVISSPLRDGFRSLMKNSNANEQLKQEIRRLRVEARLYSDLLFLEPSLMLTTVS